MTNCVNCGAPLHGSKCEYCGTEYNSNGITASFYDDNWCGTLEIGGNTYRVYLSHMEAQHISVGCAGRTMDGNIVKPKSRLLHKFTLVEV